MSLRIRRLAHKLLLSNVSIVSRRKKSTAKSTKLTKAEVEAALGAADKKMSAYYTYPVENVIRAKKKKFEKRYMGNHFYMQLGLGMTFITCFFISPLLGRRIA